MHNNNIKKAIKKGITYPITTCQDFYTHYNEGTISKEDVISRYHILVLYSSLFLTPLFLMPPVPFVPG